MSFLSLTRRGMRVQAASVRSGRVARHRQASGSEPVRFYESQMGIVVVPNALGGSLMRYDEYLD